jgi:tetratricopeptide (TPR) repeat protein
MIAHVYQELGKAEQATEFFTKAVEAAPVDGISELTYYRGAALQSLGRKREALEVFASLIEAGEGELTAEGGAGFFAKSSGKVSHDARVAQAHYLRGLGYLGLGDLDRARKDFSEAISLNPKHIWAKAGLEALE